MRKRLQEAKCCQGREAASVAGVAVERHIGLVTCTDSMKAGRRSACAAVAARSAAATMPVAALSGHFNSSNCSMVSEKILRGFALQDFFLAKFSPGRTWLADPPSPSPKSWIQPWFRPQSRSWIRPRIRPWIRPRIRPWIRP